MKASTTALLLAVGLAAPAALADESSCKQCCAAVGAPNCSTTLRVVGDDSLVVSRGMAGYEVVGMWVLSCNGKSFFDIDQTALFKEQPVTGEVATDGVLPASLRCFTEACSMPAGLCPQAVGTRPVLRRCTDGAPATDAMLAVAGPKPPSGAGLVTVVVDGRPLLATKGTASNPPPASSGTTAYSGYGQTTTGGYGQTGGSATNQPTSYGVGATGGSSYGTTSGTQTAYSGYGQTTGASQPATSGYSQPATSGYSQPATSGYSQPASSGYSQPATSGYSQPASSGYSQPASSGYSQPVTPPPPAVDVSVPKAPPASCTTADALVKESRKHVDMGNDAELVGELERAADEYRAAITLYPCNGFAWAALGSLALRVDKPTEAASALEIARKLQPNHYGAATDLGKAYEALGRKTDAVAAYQAALKANPGYAPASQALTRLGVAPR